MEACIEGVVSPLNSIYRSRFDLVPGMRLAKAVVVVERGRAILKLPAGLELNALNLSQLAAARVECVAILVQPAQSAGMDPPQPWLAAQAELNAAYQADPRGTPEQAECLARQVARVDRLFAHADPDSELTQAFKAAVMDHRRAECSALLPVMSS